MTYKDPEKQREANRAAVKRHRERKAKGEIPAAETPRQVIPEKEGVMERNTQPDINLEQIAQRAVNLIMDDLLRNGPFLQAVKRMGIPLGISSKEEHIRMAPPSPLDDDPVIIALRAGIDDMTEAFGGRIGDLERREPVNPEVKVTAIIEDRIGSLEAAHGDLDRRVTALEGKEPVTGGSGGSEKEIAKAVEDVQTLKEEFEELKDKLRNAGLEVGSKGKTVSPPRGPVTQVGSYTSPERPFGGFPKPERRR